MKKNHIHTLTRIAHTLLYIVYDAGGGAWGGEQIYPWIISEPGVLFVNSRVDTCKLMTRNPLGSASLIVTSLHSFSLSHTYTKPPLPAPTFKQNPPLKIFLV